MLENDKVENRVNRISHRALPLLICMLLLTSSSSWALDSTTVESLNMVPTFKSIGIYANYSGDDNEDNSAMMQYRLLGSSVWLTAHEPYIDRGESQARVSLVGLSPNTEYEVQVTFSDLDGLSGPNFLIQTVTTRNENFPFGTGNTYYVSPTGSDSNPGTENQPFQSIQKALDTVTTGDTVYIKEGTYIEKLTLTESGTESNYITITNFGSDKVIIDGNKGAIGDLFTLDGADYVRIKGLEFRDSQDALLLLLGADNVVIENNTLTEPAYGVLVSPSKGEPDLGAIDLQLSSKNVVIRNNTITRNTPMTTKTNIKGIRWWRAGEGMIIYNNVFQGGFEDGIGGFPEDASGKTNDVDVYDNLFNGACWDDAIQMGGPGKNVRIWGNEIRDCYISIAVAPNTDGPLYIFRNVMYDNEHAERGSTGAAAYKLGDGWWGPAPIYFYHNTYYANANADGYFRTNNGMQNNMISKNNIVRAGKYVYEIGEELDPFRWGDNDFDYNALYTDSPDAWRFIKWGRNTTYSSLSAFTSATGQDSNSIEIDALNEWVDPDNKNFSLKSGSQLVDKGTFIAGFNGPNSAWPFEGVAPDLGALESNHENPNAPPLRFTPSPTGILPLDTTEVTISLNTSKAATCKFDQNSDTDFSAMTNTFSTTGGTFHSSPASGLTNGQTFSYFVRCQDSSGNTNTDDFLINFSINSSGNIPSDNQAPVSQDQSVNILLDTPASITLVATDADNDPLTYEIVTSPQNGILDHDGSSPNMTYTPNPGFTGTDSFTFKSNDGTEDSNVSTVFVNVGSENQTPTASFTASPTSGRAPLPVLFDASGSVDSDGAIVSFSWKTGEGADLIGFQPEYTYASPGTFVVTLIITDDGGAVSVSTGAITVSEQNLPPQVDAGVAQTIALPDPATLNATVTDDGIPSTALTLTWSVVSGPGSATFEDVNSRDTTVSFSKLGTYVLRLTADDSELSASDDVTITVNPPPIVVSSVLDPEDDNLLIVILTLSDPSFTSTTIDLQLPSTNLTLSRLSTDSKRFFIKVKLDTLTSEDLSALEGTSLSVTLEDETFDALVKKNVIIPDLGGRVKEDVVEVIIPVGSLSEEAQLIISPEPSEDADKRDAALARQNLISIGAGKDFLLDTLGTLDSATLILPFDSTLIPLGLNSSNARIAFYNPATDTWELQEETRVQGDALETEVSYFSIYRPILFSPNSAAVLREVYAYPNPAVSPEYTTIRAVLGKVDGVEITIFDVTGQIVHSATLNSNPTGIVNGEYYYDYTWTGPKSSGIYFAIIHGKSAEGTVRG